MLAPVLHLGAAWGNQPPLPDGSFGLTSDIRAGDADDIQAWRPDPGSRTAG